MNVVFFLLGVPTFRNTLLHLPESCSHDVRRWI